MKRRKVHCWVCFGEVKTTRKGTVRTHRVAGPNGRHRCLGSGDMPLSGWSL